MHRKDEATGVSHDWARFGVSCEEFPLLVEGAFPGFSKQSLGVCLKRCVLHMAGSLILGTTVCILRVASRNWDYV